MGKLFNIYVSIAGEWPIFLGIGIATLGLRGLPLGIAVILAIHNERFNRLGVKK